MVGNILMDIFIFIFFFGIFELIKENMIKKI